MKKKVMLVIVVVVVVIVLILSGWYVAFCKFGVGPAFPFLPTADVGDMVLAQIPIAEDPLIADADTQEKAQEIAEQYGIKLVSYGNGIATYQTDEDPYEVIARGEKNGYAPLSINYVQEAFEAKPVEQLNPTELQIEQHVDFDLEEK